MINDTICYVFGGLDDETRFNDLYSLNVETGAWLKIPTTGNLPPARAIHTAVYYEPTKKLYIFGGFGFGGRLNDMHVLDVGTLITLISIGFLSLLTTVQRKIIGRKSKLPVFLLLLEHSMQLRSSVITCTFSEESERMPF
jgi:hypothetical protein